MYAMLAIRVSLVESTMLCVSKLKEFVGEMMALAAKMAVALERKQSHTKPSGESPASTPKKISRKSSPKLKSKKIKKKTRTHSDLHRQYEELKSYYRAAYSHK